MKLKRIIPIVFALILTAIPLGTAFAKNIGRVVISGPGLKTPIEITNHDLTNQFGPDRIDNFEAPISDPKIDLDSPYYRIDRDYIDEAGKVIVTDHLRYYPDPSTGHGLIYYESMDGGQSSNDGHWFEAQPEGEKLLREILAENGVTLASAANVAPEQAQAPAGAVADLPDAAPETPTAAPQSNLPLILAGALIALIAAGAGLGIARRRAQRA